MGKDPGDSIQTESALAVGMLSINTCATMSLMPLHGVCSQPLSLAVRSFLVKLPVRFFLSGLMVPLASDQRLEKKIIAD